MNHLDCRNDLVTRARRYRLSSDEQARLADHMTGCASCRLAHQVGEDFDAMAGVRPGDEVMLLSLANRLRRRHLARFGAGHKRVAATAAAVACALAVAAGAYAYIERRVTAPAPPVEATLASERSPSPREAELAVDGVQRVPRVDALAQVRDEAPPARRARGRSTARAHTAAPADGSGAAALFANANGERRQGNADEAIALYGELEQRYPASQEALVARVSLGRLLLARGAWTDALARLNEYLAAAPEGTLTPEALFGEARALQALGRKADERRAWERLLAGYPDSVYAAQAQRRLDDLR